MLDHLSLGFGVALTQINLLYCLIGATLGTFVGILPGLSPVTAIAMLLPITFKIPAISSLIMLAGIYYGSHHAGATTAIMLNMPGEPSSIVICLDGHPMARRGRAGVALCTSALASFFAGCVSVIVVALFSPPLADAALKFLAPDYAAAVILALVSVSVLSGRSLALTISMALLGLLLGTIGTDVNSGVLRFTYGFPQLADGVEFVAVAVGFFAFADIIAHISSSETRKIVDADLRKLIPTRADMAAAWKPAIRGTLLGGALGILPGTGPLLSSFASYALEKRLSREPSRFGNGAIEGIAGPEAAGNAAALTHFIPMLTLGVPAGATMALMLGAMLIQGIAPGPQVMTQHPQLFWGLIASMWIGNMMLLVLNLPLVGIWIRLLSVPYRFLYPTILVFCCVGVYSVNNSYFDVLVALLCGAAGYVLRQLGCSPAPLVLGLVLGPILEENVRRSLILSRGDLTVFVTRPISLTLLVLAVLLIGTFSMPMLWRKQSLNKKPDAVEGADRSG